MRLRFKSVLGFIFILIIACAAIGVGYLFYTKVSESDIVVDGKITINYLNGRKFSLNGNGSVKFSVTNNDDEQKYYYIQFSDVSANDVKFTLKSDKNLEINNDFKSDIISDQIAIGGNETVNYTLSFASNQNEKYSGTIQIGERKGNSETFASVLLANNKVGDVTLSKVGERATLDEGLIASQDNHGIAYYFRGAVTNNNVVFGKKNWKIVKINDDGSVKLVLDGVADVISKYDDKSIVYKSSAIEEFLNKWYEDNLKDYTDYIVFNTFCNDTNLEVDSTTYASYNRIITNHIPTFICLGTKISSPIGLLTADEVSLAGASTESNTSYYLYNNKITNGYFTMTGAAKRGDSYYPFMVNSDGALKTDVSSNLLRGVRPVINIIRSAKVTGDGTKDDPYQIVMD